MVINILHSGDNGHFHMLTFRDQLIIQIIDDRVALNSTHSCHIEDDMDSVSASLDVSFAF